jgi:predicted MFS family arabinose efflux permease
VVPFQRHGYGYGLVSAVFNAGVFLGIPFLGKIRDMTGGYRTSFALMAGLLMLGGLLATVSGRILPKQQRP